MQDLRPLLTTYIWEVTQDDIGNNDVNEKL